MRSSLERMAQRPVVLLYGAVAALLGWTTLPVAVLAIAARGGRTGASVPWIALAVVGGVLVEMAAARALARTGPGLLRRAGDAALFPVAMGLVALAVGGTVVFMLLPVLQVALVSVFAVFFPTLAALGFLSVVFLATLALTLPVVAMTPLGIRAMALGDRGAFAAAFATLDLFGERPGGALLAALGFTAADGALAALGARFGARDLSLVGRLGGLTAWLGTGTGAGVVMLALVALLGALRFTVWTGIYEGAAARVSPARAAPELGERGVPLGRLVLGLPGAFVRVVRPLLGGAIDDLRAHPGLLGFGFALAFVGSLRATTLLSMLRLLPSTLDSPTARAIGVGPLKLGLLALASAVLGCALVAATGDLRDRTLRPFAALRRGLAALPSVAMGIASVFLAFGCGATLILLAILIMGALLVQVFPGLDPLFDRLGPIVVGLGAGIALLFVPVVARAVLLDRVRGRDAIERGLHAVPDLGAFAAVWLLVIGLDLIRGPLAAKAGLFPDGWMLLGAWRDGARLGIPPDRLVASTLMFIGSACASVLEALLWTRLYLAGRDRVRQVGRQAA